MSLRLNIDRLTNDHVTTGHDGKPESRPPLLVELQQAVKPSAGDGGAKSAARRAMGSHHSAKAGTTTWLTPHHIHEALAAPAVNMTPMPTMNADSRLG